MQALRYCPAGASCLPMDRGSPLMPLFTELGAFEVRLRAVAEELVARIFAAELARRAADDRGRAVAATPEPVRARRGRPRDPDSAAGRRRARVEAKANAAATVRASAPDLTETRAPAAPSTRPAAAPAPVWTRDVVVDELAKWLLGGNPVEAAYLLRHKQRKLVVNAKKFFGRFEAALNAANLHLARQYPGGIPSKKSAPPLPS